MAEASAVGQGRARPTAAYGRAIAGKVVRGEIAERAGAQLVVWRFSASCV